MKINILISTHNARIKDIDRVILPYREDVSYVIVMQYSDSSYLNLIPSFENRNDIKVITSNKMGLSLSRNLAIDAADGDIAIIADDDLTYRNEYIDGVITAFTKRPNRDVGLFMIKTPDGEQPAKAYPTTAGRYPPCKGYYASSVEMAFRVKSIKGKVAFNKEFGLGAKRMNCGEEDVFLKDCMDLGLNISFFPQYITEHKYQSTGRDMLTNSRSLFSKGASTLYLHGLLAYPKMLLFATKSKIAGNASWWFIVWHTFRGINYLLTNKIRGILRCK